MSGLVVVEAERYAQIKLIVNKLIPEIKKRQAIVNGNAEFTDKYKREQKDLALCVNNLAECVAPDFIKLVKDSELSLEDLKFLLSLPAIKHWVITVIPIPKLIFHAFQCLFKEEGQPVNPKHAFALLTFKQNILCSIEPESSEAITRLRSAEENFDWSAQIFAPTQVVAVETAWVYPIVQVLNGLYNLAKKVDLNELLDYLRKDYEHLKNTLVKEVDFQAALQENFDQKLPKQIEQLLKVINSDRELAFEAFMSEDLKRLRDEKEDLTRPVVNRDHQRAIIQYLDSSVNPKKRLELIILMNQLLEAKKQYEKLKAPRPQEPVPESINRLLLNIAQKATALLISDYQKDARKERLENTENVRNTGLEKAAKKRKWGLALAILGLVVGVALVAASTLFSLGVVPLIALCVVGVLSVSGTIKLERSGQQDKKDIERDFPVARAASVFRAAASPQDTQRVYPERTF